MGVVYRAVQSAVNRVVALKVLPGGLDARPMELARFAVEAEAVAALQHHSIVQLFEYGTADRVKFLALEYVPGGTLSDWVRRTPPTPREAARLVARLAAAIHTARLKGIVDRDLKPANVLMTEAGDPKITDFGLARIGASDLTAAGAVMGTPNSMRPEQAVGDSRMIGTPTDVWSLGASCTNSSPEGRRSAASIRAGRSSFGMNWPLTASRRDSPVRDCPARGGDLDDPTLIWANSDERDGTARRRVRRLGRVVRGESGRDQAGGGPTWGPEGRTP